jgi:hypothetical protein
MPDNRPQLLAVLVLLLTAAFIASAWIKRPFDIWWRRAVIGYLLPTDLVLGRAAKWLIGP